MCPLDPALLAPPYKRFRVSRALADDYIELFINRHEYSIQATKPMMNGKIGWYLARHYKTKEPKQLDNATVRAHIDGDFTINLYSTNPDTQRCKWVAIDADYDGSMKDLLQLRYELKQDSIQAALEQSRRGGHLWIFAETPLLASECRIYIYNLALRLGIPVQGGGLRKGIEVFPKQDVVEGMDFGNAMRGPLGVHRRIRRRYWFIEAEQTPERQMAYLMKLRKVTEDQTQNLHCRDDPAGRLPASAIRGLSAASGGSTERHPPRVPDPRSRSATQEGPPQLLGAMSCLCAGQRGQIAGQPGDPDRRSAVLQMLGWLHEGGHSRSARSTLTQQAVRLNGGIMAAVVPIRSQPPYSQSGARQRSFRTAWVDPSRGDASCSEEAGHLLPVVPDARIPAASYGGMCCAGPSRAVPWRTWDATAHT